jgi:hypothetical protein
MRGALFSLVALALSAFGCSQYHYYDLDTSLDPAFSFTETTSIQRCVLTVSGADSFRGLLPKLCMGAGSGSHHLGTFEYSSLADSGNLTFKLDVYDGEGNECLTGEGTKTVPVGPTTLMDTFTVTRTAGCVCGQSLPCAGAP